jgi:ATP-binding cassette subfamily B protein
MQKLTDRLNLVARESLTGMLVIRAFGNEGVEEKRFNKANSDIAQNHLSIERTMATLSPIENFMMSGVTLLIIWVAGHAVARFDMPIGDMLAYMQYVMQIIMAFMMIAQMFIFIPRALVSATRVQEILDTEPTIMDRGNTRSLGHRAEGHIVFDHVSFKYGDAEKCVLEDISFEVKPGQTVAFIGATGSGKSTLINLIPRFYDVTAGSISLDGVDIRDLPVHELRDNIGYVPQKALLFSGDVATNMSLGKATATDEEIYQAIRVAQAADFINPENNGLEIPIAQGGDNVSGGQKQRLSIARALLANPPIFIFDDSFSALDFRTDANLRKALYESTENATVLIVAQRVSTIMNADQILVLEEGRVVGHGTHKELLQTCEAYREIAESQLSKEELA